MSAGGAGGTPGMAGARVTDDPFAGATIRVHDLSRADGLPAHGAPAAGAAPPPPVAPPVSQTGLSPSWRRLQVIVGGALVAACLGLFGWQLAQGRPAAPVAIGTLGGLGGAQRVEIRVHVDGAVAQPGVYRLAQGDRVEDAVRAAGGLAPNADGSKLNLAQRVRDEQRLDVPFQAAASQAAVAAQGADSAGAAAGAPAESAPAPEAPPAPSAPAPGPAAVPAPQPTARPTATPRPTATARPAATPRPTEFSGGKVNVNTATQAQLEQLPGFGEVSAKRIIDYRAANGPLRSTEDLRRAGITAALITRAAPYIVFE